MHDRIAPHRRLGWLLLMAACCLACLLTACLNQLSGRGDGAAGNAAVQAQLRAIQSAQNAYMASHDHYACTMAELGSQFGLIDRQLAYGRKDVYYYDLQCSANVNPAYQAWATPMENGLASPASYCIDQTGQMRRASHRLDSCAAGRPVD